MCLGSVRVPWQAPPQQLSLELVDSSWSWKVRAVVCKSRRCQCHRRAPMIEGGESFPKGRGLEKRKRGMLGLRVGGEGMGRGNGENITANAKTSRHTYTTKN